MTAITARAYSCAKILGDASLPPLDHLDAAAAAAKGPDYLFNELNKRPAKGPIKFKITGQVAEDGDVVNDATVHWPAERKVVELGTVALTSTVANQVHEQEHIIFDPIPRLDGIEPSDDPLLELRAAVYLISGRQAHCSGAVSLSRKAVLR